MKELQSQGNWFSRRVWQPWRNICAQFRTRCRKKPAINTALPPSFSSSCVVSNYFYSLEPEHKETVKALDEIAAELHERK